jgi:hypothetical protein
MTDQAPLDASVVARILRRAGDLEAVGERQDDDSSISEASLIAAAQEVGLSVEAVRRSIAIERLGPRPSARFGDRTLGPSRVCVDAEVDLPAERALSRVDSWMVDGHHLRRDALRQGRGEWSKRAGLVGAAVRTLRNVTGEGKLGVFERVDAVACDTGTGSSVVRITVDRTKNRRTVGGTGAGIAGVGATGAVVAAVAATPVLLVAVPVAVVAGAGVARTGRKRARDVEREITRVLDAISDDVGPTRFGAEVVRRATGTAAAVGSSARRAVRRIRPAAELAGVAEDRRTGRSA